MDHSPLFALPRELRDLIYEQVFADLVSNPLNIRKFCRIPQCIVCYNPDARVPGLLLTSKAIYSEAKTCLYSSCNPPRIVIDTHLHEVVKSPEEHGKRCGFAVRDLDTLVPILSTMEELNIDINAIDATPPCLPLVRWLRAVLNSRKTQLRKVSISLRVGNSNRLSVRVGARFREVCKETARIYTRDRHLEEIWLLKCWPWATLVGPSFRIAWKGRHIVQAEMLVPLPCDVAWRDLTEREEPWDTMPSENSATVQPSS